MRKALPGAGMHNEDLRGGLSRLKLLGDWIIERITTINMLVPVMHKASIEMAEGLTTDVFADAGATRFDTDGG